MGTLPKCAEISKFRKRLKPYATLTCFLLTEVLLRTLTIGNNLVNWGHSIIQRGQTKSY